MFSWNLPFLGRPILWYGFFFALGFFIAYLLFQHFLKDFLTPYKMSKSEMSKISEKTSIYVIIGTVLGARLGDVFFYQKPEQYLQDPLGIFRFWEGGLASHGAMIGIFLALWIFCILERKRAPMLSWIALLDLIAIPALFVGTCIRIGNFFNQEIIGIPSMLPWAVRFGHPTASFFLGQDNLPRHPVQLYEACGYFFLFLLLWILRARVDKIYRLGKTAGLCFIGVFLFRFFIEFLKLPQTELVSQGGFLDMGQWLSIPFVLFGLFLCFFDQGTLRKRFIKRD